MGRNQWVRVITAFLVVVGLAPQATAQVRLTMKNAGDSGIQFATVSPDGRLIVGGGEHLSLWDAATGRLLTTLSKKMNYWYKPEAAVSFSHDSKRIAISTYGDGSRVEIVE